jgi:hypothetical protein
MTHNFWFDNHKPNLAVLACLNDVVLLDWRKLNKDSKLRAEGNRRYPWIVYEAANNRDYGSWQGFKTRKAAIDWFVKRALSAPAAPENNMVLDTVVEKAVRERAESYETPPEKLYQYGLSNALLLP